VRFRPGGCPTTGQGEKRVLTARRATRILRRIAWGTRDHSKLCRDRPFGGMLMKHQRHFDASEAALREAEQIRKVILDLDRLVQILNCNIATEEERVRVFDRSDHAYPILARTLAARRIAARALVVFSAMYSGCCAVCCCANTCARSGPLSAAIRSSSAYDKRRGAGIGQCFVAGLRAVLMNSSQTMVKTSGSMHWPSSRPGSKRSRKPCSLRSSRA
jgi:hypothetical protein